MKISMSSAAILACLLCATLESHAQIAPAGAPVPPPPPGVGQPAGPGPGGPGLPGGPGPMGNQPLQTLTSLNGKVASYVANDRYEYDSFSLQTSGKSVVVGFPPHMASQLMKAAEKGASVTVNGFYDNAPDGTTTFRLVSINAGGNTITDTPPQPPATAPVEVSKNFDGTIRSLRLNREGITNGIVLSDNEVVDLPPNIATQLQALLKTGQRVSGTGIKVIPPDGVVMSQQVSIIRPQTLSVNGQTYLVR